MKRMLIRWTQQHFWLRVLLSLPLSYGFWLVARPMGFEHTFFRGMVTGLIAFAIVDLALTSGNEKRALLARLQALAQDNAVPLAKFVCGLSVLVLAMMLRTQPDEPFVQLVTSLVEVFGLLTVFFLPALSLLATNAWSRLPVWGSNSSLKTYPNLSIPCQFGQVENRLSAVTVPVNHARIKP